MSARQRGAQFLLSWRIGFFVLVLLLLLVVEIPKRIEGEDENEIEEDGIAIGGFGQAFKETVRAPASPPERA